MLHRATQYAMDVLEGRIIAGKYVKLACQRHMTDLERQGTEEFPFIFDEDKANTILEFAETLYIAEGDTKQNLVLAPFQAFIFSSLHGWVHRDTGYRRFRSSYVQVGRQQGKSLKNGVLGAFYGNFTDYKYGQLYCVATKLDQAKIVLKEMIKFIRSDDELEELFKVMEYKSEITCLNTNSTIKALGRDSKSIDGFRPYLGVVDKKLSPITVMW
jgi:phage terminase large subunit-like protein